MNRHNLRHRKGKKTVNKYRYTPKARKEKYIATVVLVSSTGHVAVLRIYESFLPTSIPCSLFLLQYLRWLDFFTWQSDLKS